MKPYHKNPRQITKKKFESLGGSLAKLGDLSGIVHDLNTDEIVGGNQRGAVFDVNKCKIELVEKFDEPDEQGTVAHGFVIWQGKRYAYRQVRFTPEKAEEANIRANKAGGAWDFDILANEWEMSDLLQWDWEESDFPFDVAGAMGEGGDTEPQIDKAEELRVKWGTATGQLWKLGEHKIICGDCTDRAVVDRVMGGEKADMVWTDPPYGVAYVGKTVDALTIENDSLDEGQLSDFLRLSLGLALEYSRAGAVWYVAAPARPLHHIFATILKEFEVWRQTLNWVKHHFVMGRSDFHYRHEPIFYGWKLGATHFFCGDRTLDTIWEVDRPMASREHPTMKPVELVERSLHYSSRTNDIIYEPFSGSGTTLIACQNLRRKCRAIEISPSYTAVCLQRFYDHSGILPTLLP